MRFSTGFLGLVLALTLGGATKVWADEVKPPTASESVDSVAPNDSPTNAVTLETQEASKDSRDLAATDQVFTAEYQDRINAAQQAEDEQKRADRARHDRLIENFMKH